MSEFSDKAKSRIYWEYKNAPKLIEWILSLPDVAQSRIVEQIEKVRNILDIDKAEGEQLNICGRIAGYRKRPVGRFYPGCKVEEVDDVLYRKMIKAKICKNNGIATIDDVKAAADYILDVKVTVLDAQDMTMRLVWHEDAVSVAVQQLVEDYDLIPRPQGVGMRKHRVIKRKPFGFGRHFNNFGNAAFWYGDGRPPIYYYGSIKISWADGMLSGQIIVNELDVSDQDVTVVIIGSDGVQRVQRAVTDSKGKFSLSSITPPATVVARALLVTLDCEALELESEPLKIN
ncbi:MULTISPECIES: DUF2612 domain-containing protein [Klebsiella]|uniref:DUF2612 domain-containing protein n=1 Tax=Klebsiella TaxID=570 RepID=UPI00117462FA|nr:MULTISPECIES: DUF2612 domain-containing protein [Klebsiella]MCW9550721.1 DUF2612 domain-containing protein [Klebsiella oxytoca]VUS78569.1 hypothetical protein SPARK1531C2_02901 [Klebsiella grimontii]